MAARQHVSIDLDADVAAILRAHAAEAHLSEGEIVDRAIRAYDLRTLLAQIRGAPVVSANGYQQTLNSVASANPLDALGRWAVGGAQRIVGAVEGASTSVTTPELSSAWFAGLFAYVVAYAAGLALLFALVGLKNAQTSTRTKPSRSRARNSKPPAPSATRPRECSASSRTRTC